MDARKLIQEWSAELLKHKPGIGKDYADTLNKKADRAFLRHDFGREARLKTEAGISYYATGFPQEAAASFYCAGRAENKMRHEVERVVLSECAAAIYEDISHVNAAYSYLNAAEGYALQASKTDSGIDLLRRAFGLLEVSDRLLVSKGINPDSDDMRNYIKKSVETCRDAVYPKAFFQSA